MGVSIVIPTWNGLHLLQEFLPSVIAAAAHYSKLSNVPTEILIVDDGSADETGGWLRQVGFRDNIERGDAETGGPGLRLVRNENNLGFGEACNRGFELAAHPLVFLLNNDVETDVDCIAPLVENFEDPSVFAAHCRVFEFDSGRECGTGKLGSFSRGFIRVHRSYAVPESREESGPPLYSMFAGGGSAMFDRQKFLEIGGFETLLSPFYWEDVELSYRAWKRGYTILYEPRSVTRHRISSTIGKLARRKVRVIEQRNRLIYHWIHLRDSRMLASHTAWLMLLAITAPLRLQPWFLASCLAALRTFPAICKRRRHVRLAQTRTDREVFDIFTMLESDSSVIAYDDLEELQQRAE
ncbi:MAG: glycosyltransferase family 2 protein [Acidobacteriota bacterium]